MPPSKGQKSNQTTPPKAPRKSRPGFGRALEPNPDRIVDARLAACPHCAAAWPHAAQAPQQVYDRIELPPIKPDVTRVQLFGGRCACCGGCAVATAPEGLEPGSPFGKSIAALAVYLHYAHAIGLKRLAWPELKIGTDLTDKGTKMERRKLSFAARPVFPAILSLVGACRG